MTLRVFDCMLEEMGTILDMESGASESQEQAQMSEKAQHKMATQMFGKEKDG